MESTTGSSITVSEDPTSERIYDDIQKLSIGGSTQLGRYHDFLLWTEIPGDSARNHSVSNLVFENEKTTGLAETATGSSSFLQANEFQRGIGAGCSNGTSSESAPVLIAVQQGPSSNMRAQSNYFGGANQEVHLWFPQSFDVQQGVHAIQYKRDETMEPSRILGPVKESNGVRIRLTAHPGVVYRSGEATAEDKLRISQ
jgi:hypothetical protein